MAWQIKVPGILRHGSTARSMAAIFVGLAALVGWSFAGTQVINSLNPSLVHEILAATKPALDVWITPPDYAGLSPIIISTPAGLRFEHDTITIPAGSIVSAHLAEHEGNAPELLVDGNAMAFATDEHGDFAATEKLDQGKKLVIRRGWLKLASWKIQVIPNSAPKVSFTEPLSIADNKNLRIAYSASDDLGVSEVALRITPHDTLPGANNAPVDITLTSQPAHEIARVDMEDLTARPWAGQKVTLQIVATNRAGHTAISDPVDFTLPERSFFHPVARVLIEERKRLMLHPDDTNLRDETANIMAGIAHEVADYHGDPVVLMALRTGAVRLILEHDHGAAISVNDLLWQAASRIENGATGNAQQKLRDARRDLSEAIRHHAPQTKIDQLTARLHEAMSDYMHDISARAAAQKSSVGAHVE